MSIAQRTLFLIILAAGACLVLMICGLWGISWVSGDLKKGADPESILATLDSANSLLWIVGLVAVGAVATTGYLFNLAIVRPIQLLEHNLAQASEHLDLTQKIEFSAEAEVASILSSYNRLLEGIRNGFIDIDKTTTELTDLTESVDTSARNIARNSNLQTEASTNMSVAVERLVSGVTMCTQQTEHARDNTMASLKAAEAGTADILNTVDIIQSISTTVEAASQNILSLRDDSNRISDMAVTIAQIAAQTNLLALNAAIEAARAGEQGRGFAVVADEVRSLAQRTAASTDEISKLVVSMEGGAKLAVDSMLAAEAEVKKGVDSAKNAGESIELINKGSAVAANSVREIFTAMQEQQTANADLCQRLEQIAQISDQNSKAATNTASSISTIAKTSRGVQGTLKKFKFQMGGERIKLRVADQHGDDHAAVKGLRYMATLLNERSSGRISLSVRGNGVLGNDADVYQQLKSGNIDMMRCNPAVLTRDVPETQLLALPFLFRSINHMHQVVDGSTGKKILDACYKAGLIGLAYYDSGARSIYATKPVRHIDDMRGLKLRVMPAPIWSAVAQAMKAVPVQLGMNELISAHRMGVIDAAENNIPTYDDYKQHEVFKYYSFTEHAMVPELIVYSKKLWDQLSEKDRDIIQGAAKDSVKEMRRLWMESEAIAKEHALHAGAKFIADVDKKSFQSAMQSVYDTIVAGDDLKALLREIQKT